MLFSRMAEPVGELFGPVDCMLLLLLLWVPSCRIRFLRHLALAFWNQTYAKTCWRYFLWKSFSFLLRFVPEERVWTGQFSAQVVSSPWRLGFGWLQSTFSSFSADGVWTRFAFWKNKRVSTTPPGKLLFKPHRLVLWLWCPLLEAGDVTEES